MRGKLIKKAVIRQKTLTTVNNKRLTESIRCKVFFNLTCHKRYQNLSKQNYMNCFSELSVRILL